MQNRRLIICVGTMTKGLPTPAVAVSPECSARDAVPVVAGGEVRGDDHAFSVVLERRSASKIGTSASLLLLFVS